MEAARGLHGYWHYTLGGWFNGGKLRTLCGRGVSPNHRIFNWDEVISTIDCPRCKKLLEVTRI